MAFSWFRAESSAVHHPKVMALKARLNQPLADAYVFRLWCWAQRFAPDGALSALIAPHLERALEWEGVAGALIQAFVDVHLLDVVGDGFEVHDWWEMQGAMVEKSNRDAKMKRKTRRQSGARSARARHAPNAVQDRTGRDETEHKEEKPPSPEALRGVWNGLKAAEMPVWESGRDDSARARLRERPDLEVWAGIVRRIAASNFCRGANDRGWRADPDFLLRPDTATRVLEGKYDDRKPLNDDAPRSRKL